MKTYVKNARLIDGTGAPAVDGAALVIEGDTIVHAGHWRRPMRRARTRASSTWRARA
jgi:hypothetical protein